VLSRLWFLRDEGAYPARIGGGAGR